MVDEKINWSQRAIKAAFENFLSIYIGVQTKKRGNNGGSVIRLTDNFLYGKSTLDVIEKDYMKGQGNELTDKMYAIHSSSALAVNAFSYFNGREKSLVINGKKDFRNIQFEKQLTVGVGSAKANLDIYLESEKEHVFIESKFLEPLGKTKPIFAEAYRKNGKIVDLIDCFDHLSIVNFMIKHTLAIQNNIQSYGNKDIFLVYLYWILENVDEVTSYSYLKYEIEKFKNAYDSLAITKNIKFLSMTYTDLLKDWSKDTDIYLHADNFRRRYKFTI